MYLNFYLGRNLISVIEKGTFEGMVFLKYLTLSRNRISQIKSGAFIGLVSIRTLNMNRNCLGQLNSEIFIGIRKVQKYLFISIKFPPFRMEHLIIFMLLFKSDLMITI